MQEWVWRKTCYHFHCSPNWYTWAIVKQRENRFLLFHSLYCFLWHLKTSHTVDSSMHYSNMLIWWVKTLDQGLNGSNKHWSTPFWINFNKHILNDSLVIYRICIFIILDSQITSENHGVRWMTLHFFVFIVVYAYDFSDLIPK